MMHKELRNTWEYQGDVYQQWRVVYLDGSVEYYRTVNGVKI